MIKKKKKSVAKNYFFLVCIIIFILFSKPKPVVAVGRAHRVPTYAAHKEYIIIVVHCRYYYYYYYYNIYTDARGGQSFFLYTE